LNFSGGAKKTRLLISAGLGQLTELAQTVFGSKAASKAQNAGIFLRPVLHDKRIKIAKKQIISQ
jgi:hypothetical protein